MNAGPVDIFKLKIIPNVMNPSPNEPTPNQRFRESPEKEGTAGTAGWSAL